MKLIDVDSNTCKLPTKCNEQISGNKNVLALRASKANQCIYGAFFSVDDDVKCDKDSVEDREVPLISELNTGWSSKEHIFPQLSHKDVETYFFKMLVRGQ
jgi:hypothetical protein